MEAAAEAQDAPHETVCVDRRLVHWAKGTGASVYAASLRRGVQDAGFILTSLLDSCESGMPVPSRAWRWTAALSPWDVAAAACPDGVLATDVFRRAQVHFDIYGRYLRVRPAVLPSLAHWSFPLPVHLAGVPNVYSVLDVIPLLQPALTPIRQQRSRRMLHRLRHEAAHLVTISETSRRDIIATLGWAPDRVTNTYLPAEPEPSAVREAAAVLPGTLAKLGVAAGDYFLHVGTIERRKNIARLGEAERASGSHRALGLAGPDGWCAADELAAAADLLVAPGEAARQATGRLRIIRLDWLPRTAILGLIQGAAALLAPSLAEGFGLPTVEAMALGTPALTSHAGAPAEIAGEAAMLVDPQDVAGLAGAIAALDRDPDLRASLSAAGLVRARMFSAQAYAGRLSALYGAVLARHAAGA